MQNSKIGLATRQVNGGEASIGVGRRNQFGEVGFGENPMAEAVLGEAVRGKLEPWRTLAVAACGEVAGIYWWCTC